MGLVEVGVSVYSPEWLPRTNRATHSLTHKVSVDADLVSFDAALVDAGRREGAECAINILRSRMCSTFRCASLRGLRALFHRAAASIIGQSNGDGGLRPPVRGRVLPSEYPYSARRGRAAGVGE